MRTLCLTILLTLAAVANAAGPGSVLLQWTAPSTNTDGSAITSTVTYHVFAGAKGAETMIATATAVSYTDPSGKLGGRCYYVTAIEAGVESAPSPEVCVNTASAPGSFGVK